MPAKAVTGQQANVFAQISDVLDGMARNRFRGVFIRAVIHFNREESAFNPKSRYFSMRFLKASVIGQWYSNFAELFS